MSHANALLESVGLRSEGSVPWDEPPQLRKPGVYVVEWHAPVATAPIALEKVAFWITRVPTLLLEGNRPSSAELVARLARFWLASQAVIYVGSATVSVRQRVSAFYRTPLGDARPHAGGHWVQTLLGLDQARVHWCASSEPEDDELRLLKSFSTRTPTAEAALLHDPTIVLPFGNRELREPGRTRRKAHRIKGSTLRYRRQGHE